MEDEKGLLERLQTMDEGAKKIYVIAGAAVVMSIIVFVWLTWFSNMNTLAFVPGSQDELATVSANPPSEFSAWQSIRSAAGVVGEKLKDLFGMRKEYIIQPEQ